MAIWLSKMVLAKHFAQFALLQLAAFLLLANFRQIPFSEKYDFDLYEGFSI
jgi:hypothetical protein